MDLNFGEFWRLDGPGQLRLIIQPLIAIVLGVRDGRLDALAGLAPYGARVLASDRRVGVLGHGLRAIAVPVTVAVAIDAIVQYLVRGSVGPVEALIVGIILVAIPYAIARSLANRVVRHRRPAERSDERQSVERPTGDPPADDEAGTGA
jgi:hypothetical protein